MPYNRKSDLPDNVISVLPAHAQDIFRKAFNNAWIEYKRPEDRRDDASREEAAHRVAWQAVKKTYEKGESGMWQRKRQTD